jgi:hypothetical protein
MKVFENIPTSKRVTTGEWKKLHKAELYNLQPSLNIVRMIKLRVMK